MAEAGAAFDLKQDDHAPVLALSGDWTVDTIAHAESGMGEIAAQLTPGAVVDVSHLGRIDMAGAFLIERTLRSAESQITLRGEHATAARLLDTARKATPQEPAEPDHLHGWRRFLFIIGRAVAAIGEEIIETVSFLGQTLATIVKTQADAGEISRGDPKLYLNAELSGLDK